MDKSYPSENEGPLSVWGFLTMTVGRRVGNCREKASTCYAFKSEHRDRFLENRNLQPLVAREPWQETTLYVGLAPHFDLELSAGGLVEETGRVKGYRRHE